LILAGRRADRPLFCPAVYEHAAKLTGKSPSEVSRDAELLQQAVLAELEVYSPDMLTVGVDIYNIEAEALGSSVTFGRAPDSVPVITERILKGPDDIDKLSKIDPEKAGRMPLMLEAARAIRDKAGSQIYVRGAVSGPVSLAAELLGTENLLVAMVLQPKSADKLLGFCTEIAISYGLAFIKRGLEVCVFDSQATPPLVSPQLYKDMVRPHTKRLMDSLKKGGAGFLEYVVGGDTGSIAEQVFESGADIVLSDFVSDVNIFLEGTMDRKILVRRNISPLLIEQGPEGRLAAEVNSVLELAAEHKNVIVGTGVISYNTDVERVLQVKKMFFERFGRKARN